MCFVVAIVAVPVADQLLPGITLLGEVDVAQVIAVALGGVGLALWVRCRSAVRLGRLQRVFLGCVLAVWILTMALSIVRSPIPLPSALLTGLLVVLVWAKPPSTRSAGRALDVLAWSLVLAAILTVAAEAFGLVDSWYAQLDLWDLLAFERSSYWLPLADVVGIDGRWAGPFIHPNRAGPVGGCCSCSPFGDAAGTRGCSRSPASSSWRSPRAGRRSWRPWPAWCSSCACRGSCAHPASRLPRAASWRSPSSVSSHCCWHRYGWLPPCSAPVPPTATRTSPPP